MEEKGKKKKWFKKGKRNVNKGRKVRKVEKRSEKGRKVNS